MFQIDTFTEARLATFTKREETHGDDKKPAFTIGLRMDVPNTMLDVIDPKIRHALYMAVEGQDQLPGVEPATPVLRCNSFEKIPLTTSHEGWTLEVDDGIDETTPMTFGGCKVDRLVVDAKQGGTCELAFRVGSSDLDAERLGRLGIQHGHSIWIKLKPPVRTEGEAIDGTAEAFHRDHPEAGDMFAQAHGGGDDDQLEIDGEPADSADASGDHEPVGVRTGRRTARGRDKTKAALEAGAKAHAEAGAGETA